MFNVDTNSFFFLSIFSCYFVFFRFVFERPHFLGMGKFLSLSFQLEKKFPSNNREKTRSMPKPSFHSTSQCINMTFYFFFVKSTLLSNYFGQVVCNENASKNLLINEHKIAEILFTLDCFSVNEDFKLVECKMC